MSLKLAQNQPLKPGDKGFSIVARGKEAAIYLYDEIGATLFGGISDMMVVEALQELGDVDTLNVYVNSPGGDVFAGTAIYNNFARYSGRVVMQIDGRADSIASLIIMAGEHIGIAANGSITIHDPFALAAGGSADLRKVADRMDAVRDSILDAYAARTGGDRKAISKMMADETSMTAKEAIDLGFADGVSQELKMVASFERPKPTRIPDSIPLAVLPKSRLKIAASVVVPSAPEPSHRDRIADLSLYNRTLRGDI